MVYGGTKVKGCQRIYEASHSIYFYDLVSLLWGIIGKKNTSMYFNKLSMITLCFDVWFTYFLHGTGYLNCKIAQLGVLGI